MSRLRSQNGQLQDKNSIYRESVIDPQPSARRSDPSNVRHPQRHRFATPATTQLRNDSSACSTCGNAFRQEPAQPSASRQAKQPRYGELGISDPFMHPQQSSKRQEERVAPPTLDDVDIEALILAYRPMLHPTVRDNLEEQYSVIEAARRERETRSTSDAGRVSGHQSQDRIKSPGPPGHNVNYHLPSASRNPVQSYFISRSASAPITRSNVSGTSANASSGQRSNFLSGEIAPESDVEERGQPSMSSRSLARAFSTSASTAASSQNELPPSPTRRVHPEMTAFMSGSVSRSSPRVTATTSRSPLSSPPISAVPARFTPSSTANVGPGSLYSCQEVNPFSASFGSNKKAHSVGDSPRSSVSSKSNNLSLRWSSGSSKTTSTSRTTPNQVSTSDDVMIISNPPGGLASSDKKKIDPNAFSWLSFEEEEEYQEETEKSIAPTMERKNSLWRESLDSLASSRLELDEDEDVLAHHFPQPPPMSRSNSVATTTVPGSDFHTPPDSLDLSDDSAGTPLSEIGDVSRFSMHSDAPSPSPSIALPAAPSMSRKSSISEMLRVHVVSPLGRSRSKGNTKSMPESKRASKKEKPAQPIRSESSSSSSSSMGRPPLPHQGLCLA